MYIYIIYILLSVACTAYQHTTPMNGGKHLFYLRQSSSSALQLEWTKDKTQQQHVEVERIPQYTPWHDNPPLTPYLLVQNVIPGIKKRMQCQVEINLVQHTVGSRHLATGMVESPLSTRFCVATHSCNVSVWVCSLFPGSRIYMQCSPGELDCSDVTSRNTCC